MASSYTSLLGLVLPVQGELQGTWGNVVNNELTSLLDTAIAGTTTLSTDADVTLSDTTGAANQARQSVILWTANGTVTRNITAPARSKSYIVINKSAGTQSIVLRGAGPTTGVTVLKGEQAVIAWDGADFVKISTFNGSISFTNVTVTGTTTLSGLTASTALALNASKEVVSVTNTGTGNNVLATSPTLTTPNLGTPSAVTLTNATGLPLTTGVTGTLPTGNGGTGLSSWTAGDLGYYAAGSALTKLAIGTSNQVLTSSGTAPQWSSGLSITTLTASSTVNLSGLTASTALALDASKNVVSVTNTGTGNNVLATSPTLVTPTLGVATATSINKVAITAPATAATLVIADGKTLTANSSMTLAGVDAKTFTLNNSLTFAGTDGTTMTFPGSTTTVVGTDSTQTLTNKRVTPRVGSVASAATITPTADTADQYLVTALATNAVVAAPSGTPTDGQKLIIRILDNGTSRTLTWTTTAGAYRDIIGLLPTFTVPSLVVYIGCIYNSQAGYWDVIAVVQE